MLSSRIIATAAAVWLMASTPVSASAALRIVTSFPQDASIAKSIGGEYIEVVSLTTGVQNPHAVDPKPSFAIHLNKADLLIVNGQNMEMAWLPIALSSSRNPRILEGTEGYLDPSQGITFLPYSKDELQATPFFSLNLIVGDPTKTGNHHYWLDPENGLVVAKNIYDKLVAMDPDHADVYGANYEGFVSRLKAKIGEWDRMMAPYKGVKIVSYHRDWIYLAKRHGLDLFAYIEPRETIPPSAGEVAVLVKKMRDKHIPVVLVSPWQPQKISKEIAQQTGARFVSLPSTVDERFGAKDYIGLFDVIYADLTKALGDSQAGR
ncbi:MAG: metal ABC transporter substrate-binding protein [Nitrospirota bacterium]